MNISANKELWSKLEHLKQLESKENEIFNNIVKYVENKTGKSQSELGPTEFWNNVPSHMSRDLDEIRKKISELKREINIELNNLPPEWDWKVGSTEARMIKKTAKYHIRVGDTEYYANDIKLDNGYVRFKPLLRSRGESSSKPTDVIKEVIVRADEIIDPYWEEEDEERRKKRIKREGREVLTPVITIFSIIGIFYLIRKSKA